MNYVRFGTTGLTVSRLCLGCMSYGPSQAHSWTVGEAESQPFYRRAWEAGITFFDTADYYGRGASETATGKYLKELAPRHEYVLATKVGLDMTGRPNGKGLSRKHISEAIDASLKRLDTDYVDLYQIHRLDRAAPMEEICRALDDAVRAGKVLYIGGSSMWAWEFAKLLGLQRELGSARFVSMQNHYNLLYREEEREMMPLCRSEGIAVIPWSPLARGMLARPIQSQSTSRSASDRYTPTLYGAPHDEKIIGGLEKAATQLGKPMAQVALAWLMSRPGVTAPIIGATKLGQLEDALAAESLRLDEQTIAALEAPYQPRKPAGIE